MEEKSLRRGVLVVSTIIDIGEKCVETISWNYRVVYWGGNLKKLPRHQCAGRRFQAEPEKKITDILKI